MKIVYIITRGDSIGGAQIHVRDCAIRMNKEGHEAIVIIGSTGDYSKQLEENNIKVIHSPIFRDINIVKDFKSIISIAKILRKEKPNIVSCHTAKAGFVGRLGSILARRKSIFTAHGWSFGNEVGERKKKFYALFEKFGATFGKKIITVSDFDYNLTFKYKVEKTKKVISIHNGLPYLPEVKRKINTGICKLIMIARFQDQKDHATLFKALSELKDLNWQLELVGDGPLKEQYINMAKSLGIFKKITFSGECRNVPEKLEDSDIYLLISNWEGFPRSIIEAMRASMPVIASDVGGSKESVLDSETGFIIKRGDIESLQEKLRNLISDPNLQIKMGIAGRKRYEENFTFNHMFEKTFKVYEEVLG